MVGQQLGRNQPALASRATWTSLWLAAAYMGAMALVYVLLPDLLLKAHAAVTVPSEFDSIRATTILLLRFVAVYCLFDAVNVVFSGALKGAGDTRFIVLTSLLITPLPLLACWLGISHYGGGLRWCWVVVTVWISAMGLIYGARFLQGRWRHMQVIEPELASSDN
jgi:multidrug resistance protein, MATE family